MRKIDVNELKYIQLDILKYVDHFCKDHNIRYYMSGGSLLGTVRHKGFIPWDDDIDIMMLRKDYDLFLKEFSKIENDEYQVNFLGRGTDYFFPYAKIENKRTIYNEIVNNAVEIGVNIDLFPIDDLPDSIIRQRILYWKAGLFLFLLNMKLIKVSPNRSCLKNMIIVFVRTVLKHTPLISIARIIDKTAQKYHGKIGKYCGVVVWGYGSKEITLRSDWAETIMMDFEGIQVPVPCGYDHYLSSLYGNYMQLPPQNKRVSHHDFEAYRKD